MIRYASSIEKCDTLIVSAMREKSGMTVTFNVNSMVELEHIKVISPYR